MSDWTHIRAASYQPDEITQTTAHPMRKAAATSYQSFIEIHPTMRRQNSGANTRITNISATGTGGKIANIAAQNSNSNRNSMVSLWH